MTITKLNSFENIIYEVNRSTKEAEALIYRSVTGEETRIEIANCSEDVKNWVNEMSKEGRRYKRQDKLYRHNQIENDDSDDDYLEHDIFGEDDDSLILPKFELKDESVQLYNAIEQLPPEQCDLIKQMFFQNKKAVEIAAERGVSKAAITQQRDRALLNLKNFLICPLTFDILMS